MRWQGIRLLVFLTLLVGVGTAEEGNLRISDYPTGRVQAGTLSAGQRGLAMGPNGVVAAVWSDLREGRPSIYAAKSLDGGRTFGPNLRINETPGTAGLFGATVTLDGDNRMNVVWFDERDGDYDIFFARERDGGLGFTPNVRVNDDKSTPAAGDEFVQDDFFDKGAGAAPSAFQTLPSVAVSPEGTIYVAWQDYRRNQADIYFAKSTDGGKTFNRNVRVNDDIGRAGQLAPSLAVDESGTLYLAWQDSRSGDPDIYFAKSTDGGNTWSRNLRVNDDTETAGQFNPSLAVDPQGGVYMAWHDLRHANADIYAAASRDGGQTFTQNIRVNDDQGEAYQFHPSLAINGHGRIAIVWEDYRHGHADIFAARSRDGGTTFGRNIRMNDDGGAADHLHASAVGTPAGEFLVIWEDQRHATGGRTQSPCRPVLCSDVYVGRLTDS